MPSDCGERAFVDHLLAEHRRLEHLIRSTLTALPAWEETGMAVWLPAMLTGLTAIREELVHHFLEEEAGGCLEEAVARCPRLSADVAEAQAEHSKLLQDLHVLIQWAQQMQTPTARDAYVLGQELRAIVQQMHAHEVRENHIMERGFSLSLENDDRT
jgi:hemerythrin HHE cation binding domain-containing protein